MTYGQSRDAEDAPQEPPTAPKRRRRGFSAVAGVRLGVLLGLVAALLVPPDIGSLHRAGSQLLGGGRGIGPASAPRSDDRLATDATAGMREQSRLSRTAEGQSALLRGLITGALDRQSAALRSGDLAGFLAVVDERNAALRGELSQRFTSLRAMQVAGWDESLVSAPTPAADGTWSAPVRLRYCFVVAGCTPVPITVGTSWTVAEGQALLTAFGVSAADQTGPRPWEVSALQAEVGRRVVVAGTSRWASRLPSILASAERAAAVTDRYSRWDGPPGRYIVYVAGPDEWARWYGAQQASWVAAYAMPLTETYTEIVLNASKVTPADAREVLQHEFTHVVTLSGVRHSYPNSWWLIEGIAEYVQNVGRPITAYRSLGDGRRYARGGWDGSIALEEPSANASPTEANGRYAVAYLAVRRLVERFGEAKMLDFFAAVARNGTGLEAASASAFGQPWAEVSTDCTRYVRRNLGVSDWWR